MQSWYWTADSLISYEMLLQLFYFSTSYFSRVVLHLSQLLWDVLLHSNSTLANKIILPQILILSLSMIKTQIRGYLFG